VDCQLLVCPCAAKRDKAMMLIQLTFCESESFDQGRRSETRRPPDRFWASLAWCPFLFSLSGSHSLSRLVMILASVNAAITPRGMAPKTMTVTATRGLKRACPMPSDDGSTAVDILGPDCDWLDRGSCHGPLLVRPGKGGKIPKSLAGRLATVRAASLV